MKRKIPDTTQPRDEAYNYETDGWCITPTSAPRPEPFTWGTVIRVHVVGDDYAIVEHTPHQASNESDEEYDPSPNFSMFVRGAGVGGLHWDCGHSYGSLDTALIGCIAWRAEQRNHGWGAAANSMAVQYIERMLELD